MLYHWQFQKTCPKGPTLAMSCGRLLENLCQWPNMEMSRCVTGMEQPAGAIFIRLDIGRTARILAVTGCHTFPWSYRGQAEVIGLQPFDEWLQSFSFGLAFESLCDQTRTAATDCRDEWQLFLATLCEWYLFFWRHLLGHTLLHMGRTNSQTQVI